MTAEMDATARDLIHQSFREASGRLSAYGHILPFFESMFTLQEAAINATWPETVKWTAEMIEAKRAGEMPLMERGRFSLDHPAAISLLKAICTEAHKTNQKLRHCAAAIEAGLNRAGDAMERGLNLFLADDQKGLDQLAAEIGIDKEILNFFLYNSLLPSIAKQERRLSGDYPANGEWDCGYCPICGAMPNLSFLSDSGGRFLVCGFCRHHWPFKRVCCPHCSNGDPETISYFFSEDEKAYRVYTCDSCKSYIKSVDTRALSGPFFAPLESIVTAHLDMQAKEMGYHSRAQNQLFV